MADVAFARVVHVLAILVWIGGVSMVTTVVLPAVRSGQLGSDKLRAFQVFEHRFALQTRIAILLAGLSGLYMTAELNLWDRFASVQFWWMHAMVCVWLLFALLLFVAEPFFLHARFASSARNDPDRAFAWLQRTHWALLGLSLITLVGAIAGSHGWNII